MDNFCYFVYLFVNFFFRCFAISCGQTERLVFNEASDLARDFQNESGFGDEGYSVAV